MRKCKNCNNDMSQGARGNFCQKCYRNKDTSDVGDTSLFNSQSNDNDSVLQYGSTDVLNLDMDKSIVELTIADLISIISQQMASVESKLNIIVSRLDKMEATINKVEEENAENIIKVNNTAKEVKTLKQVILQQQKYMEIVKRKELANNIIVTGIPNAILKINNEEITDNDEKLKKIFTHIVCDDKLTNGCNILRLPLRDGADTHSVKLQFTSNDAVKQIMNNAKLLKNFRAAKVYINYDEPYYSRKENNRLRKKKSDLHKAYAEDVIKILKGKLYHNDMIVDQFDLSNQLF